MILLYTQRCSRVCVCLCAFAGCCPVGLLICVLTVVVVTASAAVHAIRIELYTLIRTHISAYICIRVCEYTWEVKKRREHPLFGTYPALRGSLAFPLSLLPLLSLPSLLTHLLRTLSVPTICSTVRVCECHCFGVCVTTVADGLCHPPCFQNSSNNNSEPHHQHQKQQQQRHHRRRRRRLSCVYRNT